MSTPSDQTPLGGSPPTAGNFLLEIDGVQIGTFGEVSGLRLSVEVETVAEGGVNGYHHKLPGRMQWPDLVLRRGLVNSDALFAWVNKSSGEGFASAGNKLVRSTGAVTVLDSNGARLRSWSFQQAFARSWIGPDLGAGAGEALVEEIVVAHHGFTSANKQ
ncbi:MAG: phage tail protein [Mycobacteriales bacterium]